MVKKSHDYSSAIIVSSVALVAITIVICMTLYEVTLLKSGFVQEIKSETVKVPVWVKREVK
jgi:hypothetical protein